MDSILAEILPDYLDFTGELVGIGGACLVGGLLAALIVWAMGFAIYTAFEWLNGWTKERET